MTSKFLVEMMYLNSMNMSAISNGHFTDCVFVKRMQIINTTQVILEKSVYISREEISFSL